MRIRLHSLSVAVCLAFAVTLSNIYAAQVSGGEIPIPFRVAGVSAYAVVPNLSTLLDKAEGLAAKVAPGQIQPGMLKIQLGGQMGDPTLQNLGAGPLVVMVFKGPAAGGPPQPPQFALFVPAKAAGGYEKIFIQQGAQAQFADGLVIVASDADSLAKGVAQKAAYQQLAAAKIDGDARIFVDVTALMSTYGPALDAALAGLSNNLPPMPFPGGQDPTAVAKIIKMELKLVAAMVKQTDALQWDVSLQPDALNISELVCAQAGSAIADLLAAPPAGQNQALNALTTPGAMNLAARLNPAGLSALVNKTFAAMAADPDLTGLLTPEIKTQIQQGLGALGSDVAASIRFDDGKLSQEQVMLTPDPQKYLAMLQAATGIMAPDSTLGKLYAGTGMKFQPELKQNVRQYKGTQINRIALNFTMGEMPGMPMDLSKFVRDTDFAFVKGLYVSASNPPDLDAMLDKVQSSVSVPMPIQAMKVFGAGGQMYADLDFIAMLKAEFAMMPANPMAGIFTGLKGGSPILATATADKGRLLIQCQMPVAPFVEIVNAFRQMMQQRQPPGPNRPPPPPKGDF